MLGLRDCEMEWVFDKGRLYGREGAPQHLAFIVSAAYRSASKTNAELVGRGRRRAAPLLPGDGGGVGRARRSSCASPRPPSPRAPSSRRLRPGPDTPLAGLFLAGDWTDTGLPATIEGAVRSGQRAARHARAFLSGASFRGTPA